MDLILIADSGSTKTDWALIRNNGTIVKEWNSQGINPFFQSPETISSVLQEEVFPEIVSVPGAVFFYGAGCLNSEASAPVFENLHRQYQNALIEVESDLLGATRSLCRRDAGIACILGTGANNCLYDGTRIIGNIGSLGFWMGDEGSGGYLGKQLVINYLHKDLPEGLMRLFAQRYPEVNRIEILDRAYKQPFANRYFAGYTHFIHDNKSHPFINRLLKKSFDTFLEKYVLKHPDATNFPVSFVGSVAWYFKDILMEALKEKALRQGRILQRPMPGLIEFHAAAND